MNPFIYFCAFIIALFFAFLLLMLRNTPDLPPDYDTGGHKLNHSGTVAVATDRYWQFIDADTPRGVKLNLLTVHGVGTTGILTAGNISDFNGWEPLARVPGGMLK